MQQIDVKKLWVQSGDMKENDFVNVELVLDHDPW